MFSFAGDTVLDPFAGSGTTALGAAKAGRNSVSVDISAAYIANAVDRICSSAARDLHLAV
jgi:DNA modification methylase